MYDVSLPCELYNSCILYGHTFLTVFRTYGPNVAPLTRPSYQFSTYHPFPLIVWNILNQFLTPLPQNHDFNATLD